MGLNLIWCSVMELNNCLLLLTVALLTTTNYSVASASIFLDSINENEYRVSCDLSQKCVSEVFSNIKEFPKVIQNLTNDTFIIGPCYFNAIYSHKDKNFDYNNIVIDGMHCLLQPDKLLIRCTPEFHHDLLLSFSNNELHLPSIVCKNFGSINIVSESSNLTMNNLFTEKSIRNSSYDHAIKEFKSVAGSAFKLPPESSVEFGFSQANKRN